MIGLTLGLAYLVTTATAVPVSGSPTLSHPKTTGELAAQKVTSGQASTAKPGPQVVVQIQPSVQQPQPVLPQQQGALGGAQFLLPFQPQAWGPQLLMPFQPNTQSAAQPGSLPQQPQMLSPYGYFPAYSTPQGNPMFSPYGMPMFFQPAFHPQFHVPAGPVAPVAPPSQPDPAAQNPQPEEQLPQNPQFVWIQQPVNPEFGGLSSEELEMAGRMGRLGLFMPNVGTNVAKPQTRPVSPASLPTGTIAINPVIPAFGLPSPAFIPNMGVSHGGLPTGQAIYPGSTVEELPLPGALPDPQGQPVGLEAATIAAQVKPDYPAVEPTATYLGSSPPFVQSEVDFLPETTPTAGVAMETDTDFYP